MSGRNLAGWARLRHGGLLLDPQRLSVIAAHEPEALGDYPERELRRQTSAALDGGGDIPAFVQYVLTRTCGFDGTSGKWFRGTQVPAEWGRVALTGEVVKPRQLWLGANGSVLPVFIDKEKRVGIGRGRKSVSLALQWLRGGDGKLALLTNGRQWRLLFAGLDFDAWCEWDAELWFEEGQLSPQVTALRTLLQPGLWQRPGPDAPAPLLEAIQASRKGQAELSKILGERVRQAVELLVSGHGEALKEKCADVEPADIYRAAVRVVMRLVVTLFAESRELLPRDNALYHGSYGLEGLLGDLERSAARGRSRLRGGISAWPRIQALFHLIHQGSHHPDLPVPAYGGELFAPGDAASADGMTRALAVFETTCFDQHHAAFTDADVHAILDHITRTRVKVRQGRSSTWVPAPVDFSDLSSEYIGILYEGLLDFELKTAPADDPIVFLAIGDQPALPLSRLEAMDDETLRNLLEKMKDTSRDEGDKDADAEAPDEDTPEEGADDEDEEHGGDGSAEEESTAGDDVLQGLRVRAEQWARRAVAIGNLAKKPRGQASPEKKAAYEEAVARKARQIVVRVVLPGDWYLARWGGTRKGSGTYYTRPGLAVPTVHRTLRPLLYDNADTPESAKPRLPEQILALKIVDPACGSGTFPVAALRFVTDTLYASLLMHERISEEGDRSLVALLQGGSDGQERLQEEMLPCRVSDEHFEPRLKAILRRHVVERCIYGVDLDPIAVELCRLALWVETMDRTQPFSFLDHKIRCGNGIVGAWYDNCEHYPVMAWKNRDGGDAGHSNGVHIAKGEAAQAFGRWLNECLVPDLRSVFTGQRELGSKSAGGVIAKHSQLLESINRLHELPVHESAARARCFREHYVESDAYLHARAVMDLWCACWFWPADKLVDAPLASEWSSPRASTLRVAKSIAAERRFFHWELEYPDVFRSSGSGFDAVLGNPPWETLQPNSKEFFSNIDPLYRTYGKQEALAHQTGYFADRAVEESWVKYNAGYADDANWMKGAGNPFGDPEVSDRPAERFAFVRGASNAEIHRRWRNLRRASRGFADPMHPFTHRGEGKAYTYKLFVEQAHALMRPGGRLGFIVPSGLYSDYGTRALRDLLLKRCQWEWIFGFENREKVFDIDSRFKFNPIIVQKGGATQAINTAFMRRRLEDWERAEAYATPYSLQQVERFSPKSMAILEIQSARDLEILEKIYSNSVLLGDNGPDGWGITYAQGDFNMTSDSKLFPPRPKWEAQGYRPDEYSRWLKGNWRPIAELWAEMGVDPARPVPLDPECEASLRDSDVIRGNHPVRCAQPPYDRIPVPRADIREGIILSREADAFIREGDIEGVALPLYEGRMIGQFDFSAKGWVSGRGRASKWRDIPWSEKAIEPQFLMDQGLYFEHAKSASIPKVFVMDVTSTTNTRTVIGSVDLGHPGGHKTPILSVRGGRVAETLKLCAVLNSFAFDYLVRQRLGGNSLIWAVLEATPIPKHAIPRDMDVLIARLAAASRTHVAFLNELGPLTVHDVALTERERILLSCQLDACVFTLFGLSCEDVKFILQDCDRTVLEIAGNPSALFPKGFWRVDKSKDPCQRRTVLTVAAFEDLQDHIAQFAGDLNEGIRSFLARVESDRWCGSDMCASGEAHSRPNEKTERNSSGMSASQDPRKFDWQVSIASAEKTRELAVHLYNLRAWHRDSANSCSNRAARRSPESTDESTEVASRKQKGAAAQRNLFPEK